MPDAESTAGPVADGQHAELSRSLSLRHLVVYGMIFIVPIAPVAVYGFVARDSFGMVPLVYLVGVIAMVFTALSYRQMSREFPSAGSVYAYVREGLHPYVGFIAGWMILADYLLIPALAYVLSATWMHGLLPGVPGIFWIVLFVVLNTVINILGIKLQAHSNFVLLFVELAALIIFIVLAVHFVFFAGGGAGGWSLAPLFDPRHLDASFVAKATTVAALSFLGFDAISTLAEEAKHPRRDVGNATVIVLVIMGSIFMFETYIAALVHPDYTTLDAPVAFFQIAREVGGQPLYALLIVVDVIAVGLANSLASQSAIARILYSMGRDRILPASRFLMHIHPRFKTPVNAIVVVACLSVILALALSEEALIKLVNFGALSAFMLLNVSVFAYFFIRKRRYAGVFRYLVLPLAGLAIVGFVWSGFDRTTFVFGGVWLLLGIILRAVRGKRAQQQFSF
ncbi:MAG TPA: APC family permease [Rhodanobacteraceae bacterium]